MVIVDSNLLRAWSVLTLGNNTDAQRGQKGRVRGGEGEAVSILTSHAGRTIDYISIVTPPPSKLPGQVKAQQESQLLPGLQCRFPASATAVLLGRSTQHEVS